MIRGNEFITVDQARACCSTPIVDTLKWIVFSVLPVLRAARLAVPLPQFIAGMAAVAMIEYVLTKLIQSLERESCYERIVQSHALRDRRITVASAAESPTGSRVRKRIEPTGHTFIPGGGTFGGAGSGSVWGNDQFIIEPNTGAIIPLPGRGTDNGFGIANLWGNSETGETRYLPAHEPSPIHLSGSWEYRGTATGSWSDTGRVFRPFNPNSQFIVSDANYEGVNFVDDRLPPYSPGL